VRTRLLARLSAAAALASFAVLAAGCGPGTGTVSGKVTYKSKPVASGTVTAIAADGVARPGQIAADGTYSIPAVPSGDVTFLVASPNPDSGTRESAVGKKKNGGAGDLGGAAGGPEPAPAVPKGAWVPLPDDYADPAKSGLKKTVKGDSVIDLDLK
jgi:hypothetical protein